MKKSPSFMQQYNLMLRQFEKVKDLDSRTFVEIPQKQIVKPSDYRRWLVEEIEYKWMTEFNSKNTHYRPCFRFNEESGIGGYFGEEYISHSKLYRYDGTHYGISEDDFRAKRGILIRDHYSERDVVKVQSIADNLVEFLSQKGIEHIRTNFKK